MPRRIFFRIKRYAFISFLLILLSLSIGYAQPTDEQTAAPLGFLSKTTVIPPAPEAASLGQYGNVPVSLYNGRINLSVPIYELKGKEISLPISLSYNSGGFKVAEDPGWAGLGWTLNAGGVITRFSNGRPDQCGNYYDKAIEINAGTTGMNDRQRQDFYENISKGYIETQPDSYFFNFANSSGKFYINANQQIVQIDHKPVSVQFDNICINESVITVNGPDGSTYLFNDREVTSILYDDQNNTSAIDSYIYTSSWYLSKIISPNAIDTILFEYQYTPSMPTSITPLPESMSYSVHGPTMSDGSGSTTICGDVSGPTQSDVASISIARIFLSKIKYKKTEIIFSSSNSSSAFGGQKLDHILITSGGIQTRKVSFNYSYFDEPSEINDLRLRLDRIIEYGPVGQVSPPYEFTYSSLALPSIYSKSIDHWGYYNGSGNASLIPNIQDVSCVRGAGANRETDPEMVKAGSLIKMKYPTRGYTEFTYGPHVRNNTTSKTNRQIVEVGDSNTAEVLLGGIYQTGQTCAGSAIFQIVDLVIPETSSRVTVNTPTYVWNEQLHGEGAKVFAGVIKADNFTFSGCDLYSYVVNNYQQFDYYWFLEQALYPTPAFGGLIPGNYKMIVLSEFSSITPQIGVTYYTQELQDVTTNIPIQYIGGLRIEKITDYDASSSIASTLTYEYDNAKSFGDPNYFSLSSYFLEAPDIQWTQGAPAAIDYTSLTILHRGRCV